MCHATQKIGWPLMSCKYYLTYHVICTNSSWPVMPYRYYIIDLSCHSKSDDLSYHTETCWPVPPIGRCRWYEGGWWLSVVKVWWGWECQLPVPWPRDSHHQVQGWVVTERGEGLAGVTVSAAGPLAQVFTLTRYKGGLLVVGKLLELREHVPLFVWIFYFINKREM